MPFIRGHDGETHLATFEDASTGLCGIDLCGADGINPDFLIDFADVHQACQDIEMDNASKREREGRRRAGVTAGDYAVTGPSMEEGVEEMHRNGLDAKYFEPPYDPMN